MCGSTTCSTSPAATAASNAVPPFSSTAMPAAEASQCVEAIMPNVPASCGLVVNDRALRQHGCSRGFGRSTTGTVTGAS